MKLDGRKEREEREKREKEEQRCARRKAAIDLLYFVCCAVNGAQPKREITETMQWRAVYAMSRFHNLEAMSCMAIENCDNLSDMSCVDIGKDASPFPDPELMKKWQEKKNKAIRKNILFDVERSRLYGFFDSQGIWYLPLKGIVIKDLYPKAGMRQMSDNDILFDGAFSEEVHDWFQKNGYMTKCFGKGVHDSYHKPPVYNFEMHTSLFSESHDPIWAEYYADVKKRLLPDGDGTMRCHFSDEDFYIYMILHEYKHYRAGGTGLRSLLDTYLYNHLKGDALDRGYIEHELKGLKADQFERISRELGKKLFSDPAHCTVRWIDENLTGEEQEMLECFLFSGTYGTMENLVTHSMQKLKPEEETVSLQTKLRYIRRRCFPEMAFYRNNYPFFYRHKYLIPFFWIYRFISRMADHGGDLWKELKIIWKIR